MLAEVEGFRVRGLGGVRGSVGRIGRDVITLRRAVDGNTVGSQYWTPTGQVFASLFAPHDDAVG